MKLQHQGRQFSVFGETGVLAYVQNSVTPLPIVLDQDPCVLPSEDFITLAITVDFCGGRTGFVEGGERESLRKAFDTVSCVILTAK